MTTWIKGTAPLFDFYDILLFKYYGKVVYGYDMADNVDRTVVMYSWNGMYYIDEVMYETD